MTDRLKFFVGNEYTEYPHEKFEWLSRTFTKDQYQLRDEGYLIYEYYIEFYNEADATLYKLRWE